MTCQRCHGLGVVRYPAAVAPHLPEHEREHVCPDCKGKRPETPDEYRARCLREAKEPTP